MTPQEVLFQKYRGKRIFLDSNLLLLYMVGLFERDRIEVFKRTSRFSRADFDSLSNLLTQFNTLVTTPHVLTEVSNLSNSLPEHLKATWFQHFAERVSTMLEILNPAMDLTSETAFNPFGLTDASVQQAAKNTLILTEDFRLSGYLRSQGIDALNFRELCP